MTGPLVPVYQSMSVRETFSPGLRHEPELKVTLLVPVLDTNPD
jgi:hypothetical protein